MQQDRIWTLLSRKLAGEATHTELFELNNLLQQHPDNDILLQFIEEFWCIPAEADEEFLEATFHLHHQRLQEKGFDLEITKQETGTLNTDFLQTSKKRKIRLSIYAAIACALVGIVFFSFFYSTKNSVPPEKIAQSEVSTKNGSRTKIQLPDGTLVWLNSGSKIIYNNQHFGATIREVNLVGEAYFDVVKNAAKPFIIHTTKMDIKVLGTAFNVKCYPGDKNTETSLIRGSIEVTLKDRPEKIIMKPNEKLILNNDDIKPIKINSPLATTANAYKTSPIIALGHLTLYPKDSSIVETGWVENRLVFTDERLEDIAKKMERWYGVSIVITNENFKNELLTGSFEKETIYQALNALQLTTPFIYKINNDVITISK